MTTEKEQASIEEIYLKIHQHKWNFGWFPFLIFDSETLSLKEIDCAHMNNRYIQLDAVKIKK